VVGDDSEGDGRLIVSLIARGKKRVWYSLYIFNVCSSSILIGRAPLQLFSFRYNEASFLLVTLDCIDSLIWELPHRSVCSCSFFSFLTSSSNFLVQSESNKVDIIFLFCILQKVFGRRYFLFFLLSSKTRIKVENTHSACLNLALKKKLFYYTPFLWKVCFLVKQKGMYGVHCLLLVWFWIWNDSDWSFIIEFLRSSRH
jgi:hypothetical protein